MSNHKEADGATAETTAFDYPDYQNHSAEILMDCPLSELGASRSKFHVQL